MAATKKDNVSLQTELLSFTFDVLAAEHLLLLLERSGGE
jgi:hypothetical protein